MLEDADAEEDFQGADITILPPDTLGNETDGDSDDELISSGNPNCLSRNQLLADACARIQKPDGDLTLGLDVDAESEVSDEDVIVRPPPPKKPKRVTKQKSKGASKCSDDDMTSKTDQTTQLPKVKLADYKPSWVKKDLKVGYGVEKFPWKDPTAKLNQLCPVALFESIFTPELMKQICNESQQYAAQKGQENFDLDVPTLKLFLAILLISGYVPLPRRPMYWESNGDVHNQMVSTAMSRNRFSAILANIHFADNNSLDPGDKFAKVRPLLDHLNAACLANFQPEQVLSVDESMVPYFGRHGAKQYIHGKPIKFGYKMWVLATRLGYCIQFFPYQGAGTTDKDIGLGGSVVSTLIKNLPDVEGSAYHVIFDNFFTSPRLLRLLADRGIAATGTVRPNRTEGACLRNIDVMKKEPRGSYDVVLDRKSDVCLVRWNDNRVVTVASTYAGVAPLQKAKRFSSQEKKRIEISQPKSVQLYNYGMGGVDRLDQNVSSYMIQHRSKKWYWPVFRFCVDVAVQNAFQLYRLQEKNPGAKPHDLLSFRREIVHVYMQCFSPQTNAPALFPASRIPADRRVLHDVRTDSTAHWIVQGSQRRCAAPGCVGTSVYSCEKCNVGLHPGCFKQFHTM